MNGEIIKELAEILMEYLRESAKMAASTGNWQAVVETARALVELLSISNF